MHLHVIIIIYLTFDQISCHKLKRFAAEDQTKRARDELLRANASRSACRWRWAALVLALVRAMGYDLAATIFCWSTAGDSGLDHFHCIQRGTSQEDRGGTHAGRIIILHAYSLVAVQHVTHPESS